MVAAREPALARCDVVLTPESPKVSGVKMHGVLDAGHILIDGGKPSARSYTADADLEKPHPLAAPVPRGQVPQEYGPLILPRGVRSC